MTAPIERSHYWVFDEHQLAEAINAWLLSQKIVDESEVYAIWDFLQSDECAEHGMRRGGDTDDSPARTV